LKSRCRPINIHEVLQDNHKFGQRKPAMPKLTVQVRTHDDLRGLLAAGESPAWVIVEERQQQITHVQVVNFEARQMIEGVFDRPASTRRDDGRLVLRFLDGRIVNCRIQFDGQNPVRYAKR
jgi:hypothetical protein